MTNRGKIASSLLVATAIVSATIAIGGASAHPNSQWASPRTVEKAMIDSVFQVIVCRERKCTGEMGRVSNLDPSAEILGIDLSNGALGQLGVPGSNAVFDYLDVYAAKAKGLGKSRLVNAERRYQDFEVRICGKDKTARGTIKQAQFIWHTKRPKTHRKIIVHVFREMGAGVYEYQSTIKDDGRPYAQDFAERDYKPVGHLGCPLQ